MPSANIYLNNTIYAFLLKKGNPSTVGKEWIEQRYEQESAKEVLK